MDLSGEFLKSFSEYSSLNSTIDECLLFQQSDSSNYEPFNPFTSGINNLLQFQAEHNISNAATIRLAQIQNEMSGSQVEIPPNIKRMEKNVHRKYEFEYYVFCGKCKEVVKCDQKCPQCDIKTIRTRDNYFIYIPVKQQIILALHKHFDTILEFVEKDRAEDTIQDVYDGKIFKSIKQNHPESIILSLTFNLDGASVSNSSNSSIWPILLVQNYLPPNIRYLKENVLLAGVITTTKSKPDLSKLILPFSTELNALYSDKITVIRNEKIYQFLPLAMFCLCDLPARADMQQIKNVAGYFACPVCLQKGTSVRGKGKSKYVRYSGC